MKNKKIVIPLIIVGLLLIIVIIYALFFRNKIDYSNYESINDDYYVIDKTETCATALEEIYKDDEYTYYLTCIKSETIFIIDKKSKEEYTLRYAIENNIVTIEELKASSILVHEEAIYKIVVTILGTNIRLRENHGTEFDQIGDYQVTKGETYDLLDTHVGETYTWYQIEYEGIQGWFADNGTWASVQEVKINDGLEDLE